MIIPTHWVQAAADARVAAEPHTVTFVDFLTVTLTALSVILTALAIMIAVVAVWGYGGIKQAVTDEIKKNADNALQEKLKEYPAASAMMDLARRVEQVEALKSLLSVADSPDLANKSKLGQDGIEGETPQSLANDYPPEVGE